MDQSYQASEDLLVDFLGCIFPPAAVREVLRDEHLEVDETQLLPDSEVDAGTNCRVELAKIEDDTLPDVERKV